MEEDGGVKAPMTRLRRRLSVEATEDTKSPAGTPTKKRGGKLAAKPQLDLIDENAVQNSPKRTTRKSLARDIGDVAAEKPVTPARRSTRIKSNTSLVSETSQSCDSPRAKRAVARRNSQIGSDTESSNTPARTRRTRKDSTSSIDKIAIETPGTPGRTRRTTKVSTSVAEEEVESKNLIKEVISEEPEVPDNKNEKSDHKNVSPSARKSPRLAKKDRKSTSSQPDNQNIDKSDKVETQQKEKQNKSSIEQDDATDGTPSNMDSKKDRLSMTSANLIKELDVKPRKSSTFNKSSSAVEGLNNSQSKRQRTKSWTTLTVPTTDNHNFFSDNEETKKKKKHEKSLSMRLSKGSGDSVLNGIDSDLSKVITKDTIETLNSSTKKKKNRNNSTLIDSSFTSANKSVQMTDESKPIDTSNESNKENEIKEPTESDVDLLFKTKPTNLQCMVLVDDSDSNTDSISLEISEEKKPTKPTETGDQCVPVVDHQLNNLESGPNVNCTPNIFNVFQTDTAASNNSCEPMDIDETVSKSVILNDSKDNINESILSQSSTKQIDNNANASVIRSKRKSSISNKSQEELQNISQEENEKSNKSRRKSSLTNVMTTEESNVDKNINKSKRKSILDTHIYNSTANLSESTSLNQPEEPVNDNERDNKFKRKSMGSTSISQDLEKSGNENKSTLVLSQIKDTTVDNNVLKSIQDKSAIECEVLSKSISEADNSKKLSKNLNISNDYMTSTPVQNKNIKKMVMQMNSSVITPTDNTKKCNKTSNTPTKDISVHSKNTDSSESDDDESKSKNSLVIDEVEDAGDDYESGDSQDEEERQYEQENEIVEKGETLESEQDISDDTDYEKDSFVVSSDEEDNDLLSGSGDDLDMSDNELNMSAKSKKKYDEKAKKIQKIASREMYAARHNLDISNNRFKNQSSNKNNRLRLDSSQSDDVMQAPPKKNKRMRLDTYDSSNNDMSVTKSADNSKRLSISMSEKVENESATEEIGRKKKKVKRLSESICENEPGDDVTDSINTSKNKKKKKRLSESFCNQSVLKEHEITVGNSTEIEESNVDPLIVNVKQEPKTPQKDLDISTVHFTCTQALEQVTVDENTSLLKYKDTVDPLQSTMAENDDEDSDVSSISENEEISKGYDSVLNELNKECNKKVKINDISLDNNKRNKKKNDTIIEQLNITQPKVKTPKKLKNVEEKKTKQKKEGNKIDEASSDSIDLKLLFSDDSNDSAPTSIKENEAADSFIPLKRTDGKTNIRGSIGTAETTKNYSLLNTSTKSKNKNRKSSQSENAAIVGPILENQEAGVANILNTSSKKKKNRKSLPSENVAAAEPSNQEAEATILNSSSKKKKNRKSSQSDNVSATEPNSAEGELKFFIDTEGTHSETSQNNILTSSSMKKQKVITSITTDKNILENNEDNDDDDDAPPTEISFMFSKNDKLNKHNSESKDDSLNGKQNTAQVKTPKSKKKKNKSLLESKEKLDLKNDTTVPQNKSNNKKRKRSALEDKEQDISTLNESQTNKKKKKQKISHTEHQEPANKVGKKRKEREDDVITKKSKIIKEDLSNKNSVPRLPTSILNKLEDKPNTAVLNLKKSKLISTSEFTVEETTVRRKKKPSNYLEESVYLNDDPVSPGIKKKAVTKIPKVLPFMPTVSTSDSGFTTKFQVNVLPKKIEFVAQTTDVTNFKSKFLQERKIKKLRTYDVFKQNRHIKLSKY